MKYLPTAAAVALLTAPAVRADVFYPMLMSISPVAIQAGTTTECEISARYNLHGTYQVFVTGEGVVGEVDPPKEPLKPGQPRPQVGKIKVRFEAAPDALLGVRDVRVATPQGVSTLGQLVVARDPIVREAANNDTMKTAQPIALPATVCGAIEKAEDVDYYKFTVAAGTALTFHVRAQRLENRIHDLQEHADPILTLRNSAGTVLASNDNYFFGDPLLYYRFAAAGEYYLEIRDVRYGGNPDWQYSIEINDRPFVTNVFPSRVTPGKTTRVQLAGYNLPPGATANVTLPANTPDGLHWAMLTVNTSVAEAAAPRGDKRPRLSPPSPPPQARPLAATAAQRTNAAPIIISRLPEFIEAPGGHATPAAAQKLPFPAGVSGRIEKEGEVDCYAFDAKAGERFTFRVIAREHQSAIDSVLRVLDEKGNRLVENDDASDRYVHADSLIENWAAPANGRYVVEVRDLHGRGGPEFVYFLEVTRAEPYFTLELDTDKTLLAPGISGVIFARVVRKNGFAGEVQLAIDGLPAGVTATCGRILADGNDGCILLKAAPDAKMGAANVRVSGSSVPPASPPPPAKAPGPPPPLTAVARPLQEIYMPGGGRFHYPADVHTVSVSEPLDLKSVKITPTAVSLKPGEAKKIDVTIERAAGFKANVTLDVVYQHLGSIFGNSLPAGVTVDDKASQTVLTGEQTKGSITLRAAPDAKPVSDQLVPVMAHVSINFVMKFTYCGEPLRVTVTKGR